MGRRRALPPRPGHAGQDEHAVGRLPRSGRSVRCGLLRYLTARSTLHGPAAPHRPRGRVSGPRGRGHAAREDLGLVHGSLHRPELGRLLGREHLERERSLPHGRELARDAVGTTGFAVQFHRPEHGAGHRVLVVPRRDAPRVSESPPEGVQHRAGRGRERHSESTRDHGLLGRRLHVSRWPVQGVRCPRRWLRTRRGLRDHRVEAPGGRARRRRPDLGADSRDGRQPGRSERRPYGSESQGPAARDQAGARRRTGLARRPRVCGSARNGHAARRPDRDRSTQCRSRWPARGRFVVPHRKRQIQPGPPRSGRGHHGSNQDGPRPAARGDSAPPPLHEAEPAHLAGEHAPRGCHRSHGVARGGEAALRGCEFLRFQRDQRARRPGRGAGGRRGRGTRDTGRLVEAGAVAIFRAQPGGASRECALVPGTPGRRRSAVV